jgi:predicted nucleic acid-binding Zn ribbon protein
MSDVSEEKSKARRTILLLYALMAVGILLPFVLLWFKR